MSVSTMIILFAVAVLIILFTAGSRNTERTRKEYDLKRRMIEHDVEEYLKKNKIALSSLTVYSNDEKNILMAGYDKECRNFMLAVQGEILLIPSSDIRKAEVKKEETGKKILHEEVVITLIGGSEYSYPFITKPIRAKSYVGRSMAAYAEGLKSQIEGRGKA